MFTRFTGNFFRACWYVKSIILALSALIPAGAVAITVLEKIPFSDALYFAFVTGLTNRVRRYRYEDLWRAINSPHDRFNRYSFHRIDGCRIGICGTGKYRRIAEPWMR